MHPVLIGLNVAVVVAAGLSMVLQWVSYRRREHEIRHYVFALLIALALLTQATSSLLRSRYPTLSMVLTVVWLLLFIPTGWVGWHLWRTHLKRVGLAQEPGRDRNNPRRIR